jgi:hypothetical protein
VADAPATGVSAVGREHPASRHKQATSTVREIFFIMVKQQPFGPQIMPDPVPRPSEGGHRVLPRSSLLHAVNLDQGYSDPAVLPDQDRGELPRGQQGEDTRLVRIREREAVER